MKAFARYCQARCEALRQELLFRVYLTDALRILCDDLAHAVGGSILCSRYAELLHPEPPRRAGDIENLIRDRLRRVRSPYRGGSGPGVPPAVGDHSTTGGETDGSF